LEETTVVSVAGPFNMQSGITIVVASRGNPSVVVVSFKRNVHPIRPLHSLKINLSHPIRPLYVLKINLSYPIRQLHFFKKIPQRGSFEGSLYRDSSIQCGRHGIAMVQ
jgi:hypothetical protein